LPKKKLPRRPHKPATNKYADDDSGVEPRNDDRDLIEMDPDEGSSDQEVGIMVEEYIELVETEEPTENTLVPCENAPSACSKEVQHMKRRVQNIRETMALSHSISDPMTYQDNVLNAVANCVNEWRSIATHYPTAPANLDQQENETVYMADELKKPSALAVYEMIQHAIQCGPLAGSKPGYFKRCGGEVAKVVVAFLDQVVPNSPELIACMGFTSRQIDAMEHWKKSAEKAAMEDRPPSRTALKHQQGKGTGKKAKKKMKG
jgi:hypothetical protein